MKQILLMIAVGWIVCSEASATTYFVNASRPDDAGAGTSWAAAKKTIQAALNARSDEDDVVGRHGKASHDSPGKTEAIKEKAMGIAVVIKNGQARRVDPNTGTDKGSVGSSNVVGCSISEGIIILNYANGQSRRYDARTGSDKGSV